MPSGCTATPLKLGSPVAASSALIGDRQAP
jgi:hypothetical protein